MLQWILESTSNPTLDPGANPNPGSEFENEI